MGQNIAHVIGKGKRQFRVGGNKLRRNPLNLLYANECLDMDSLWLRFFNKYLAYHGAQNAISLNPGSASRYERLCGPVGRHLSIQTTGPLVSVIMPLFDASATLRKAAQSILDQTWQNIELILVDDLSQDNSLQIAHDLQNQDARVKVLALNTNGGPYVAKNVGLTVAKGQYLTVHDADDWAFPTRIAQQLQPLIQAKAPGLAVSMGRTLRCDMNGQFFAFHHRCLTVRISTKSWALGTVCALGQMQKFSREFAGLTPVLCRFWTPQ